MKAIFYLLILLFLHLQVNAQGGYTITYMSYLGGEGDDSGRGIAMGEHGNIIVSGFTASKAIAEGHTDRLGPAASTNIFWASFGPDMTDPPHIHYFGGSGVDESKAMGLGNDGAVYLTGRSRSYDFPATEHAFGKMQASTYDIVVVKLDEAAKQVLYATIFGGRSMEEARGIAIDDAGHCIVVGGTHSTDFPVSRFSHQAVYASQIEPDPGLVVYSSGRFIGEDAFITKVSPDGTSMIFSTFFGGQGYEKAWATDTDAHGNIYVTGYTTSDNLTVSESAYQKQIRGTRDAFILKLSPEGQLMASTYFGGREDDAGMGIAIDNQGRVWVAGNTSSHDLPVADAIQQNNSGGYDIFLACFDQDLRELLFCSYLGGEGHDQLASDGLFIDPGNNIVLTGTTRSAAFPTRYPVQNNYSGSLDGFCVMINGDNKELLFASYIGGSGTDVVSKAFLQDGRILISGTTDSTDLPVTTNAFQKTLYGKNDAFWMLIERKDYGNY